MSRFTIQALCILACLLFNAALAFTTSKAAISSSQQQQRAASSLSAATLPMSDNTNTKGLWELQLYDDSENYDFYVEKCLIKLACWTILLASLQGYEDRQLVWKSNSWVVHLRSG